MSFVANGLEIDSLEKEIRHGLQPDNPALLATYINIAEKSLTELHDVTIKRRLMRRVYQVLLDTICDTYVPQTWRMICMDSIYRPLFNLERLAKSDLKKAEVMRLRYEMRTLCQYFL